MRVKKRKVLAVWGLMIFLPFLVSCSQTVARKLESPAQLPPSQETTQVRTMAPYIMEVGDEVSVKVWGFDDLTKTATIDNSGEINLPLLGNLKLAGQTMPRAREMIATRLKKYIIDPQVDVTSSVSRQQVYVFGEVTTPGSISYRRPLMVLEAISRAGWFNRDANRQTVLLVRRSADKFHVFSVDTAGLFQDGSKIPEVYLQSGDLVYVSPRGIVQLERFLTHLQTIAQPFLTIEQAVVLWPQFIDALRGKTPTTGLAIGVGGTTTTSTTSTTTTK
jgi:polysaccharide export outer membrane protein